MEKMTLRDVVKQPEVRTFLQSVRDVGERRTVTNVNLLVPDVMIGLLEETALQGSVAAHVRTINATGTANLIISGDTPDGVWIDCCGSLSELSLSFYNWTFGCWGVGGYVSVCNAMLQDSDINLASYIVSEISKAIANAVDKAIINGTGTSQPMGITTRLAQTAAPSNWPATAPAWTDLHTSNVITSVDPTAAPADFFTQLAAVLGLIQNSYTSGELFWVMNTQTYATILSKAIGFDSAGAVVANGGMYNLNGRSLPLLGGTVVIRDWMPANEIVGGYGDGYVLIRRQGLEMRRADELMMLSNQTIFAGFARYDGYPVIANAFVQITLTA